MAEWLKAADCKSAHVSVRRFESFPAHQLYNQGVTLIRNSFLFLLRRSFVPFFQAAQRTQANSRDSQHAKRINACRHLTSTKGTEKHALLIGGRYAMQKQVVEVLWVEVVFCCARLLAQKS